MKKMKLLFMASVCATSSMFAQTLNDAIKLTNSEQFEKADAAFKTLTQGQPNNGEFLFYYGENFFKNDQPGKANEQYQKAVDVNATNPFGYIGLGKVQWYNGKQAEAKANFYKATTLAAGKNVNVLLRISEAYTNAETKNLPEAITLLTQAAKLDPKNPEVYILTGNVYLEQNEGTKAIENYEKAGALDPKSPLALLRQGQVWNRAKNYTLAIDTYKKALKIDSTFAPAYREMAEIYLRAGQFTNAAYNAKRYLDLNKDCSAQGRYAGILFEAKQYKESVTAAQEAQACDTNNIYINRYLAFAQYEAGDYPNGLMNSDVFFRKLNPNVKVLPKDYEYRAKLLSKNGKDSLAIIDYKKALELQPEKVELNADIANSYIKMKKYPEAIAAYKLKIATGKTNANDQFGLGRAYYFAKDYVNADSAFMKIIESQPELGTGYFWRARVNSQLDPKSETGAAKPFYEQFISKVKPEEMEKNKKDLIEAYNYLAAFYAAKKDCPNVKVYMQKVLDIDPSNAQAKKVIAGLKC
ncbi:MAG TPA: tetratricopeptide repeat protein [Bacteroidia bacterium]|jgi:tetratricopeptide (TPR) repeat protein